MARGSFSTPMTEDTIVEFGTVMKLLSLMNINSERLAADSGGAFDWGGHPRPDQRPHPGIWDFHREYAGGGSKRRKLTVNTEALTRDVIPSVSASLIWKGNNKDNIKTESGMDHRKW